MSTQTTRCRDWVELSFSVDPEAQEALSAFLFELGCNGIAVQDFGDQSLRAYFPGTFDPEILASRIQSFLVELTELFEGLPLPSWEWCALPDQDWSLTWRRFFHPTRITSNLLVLPAWEPTTPWESLHIIKMDPGPAFGTGQHPTTRMCLEALEVVPRPEGWTMLDLGTGSGILAIYGARLGAGRILALDNDPEALAWAEKNLEINGMTDRVELSLDLVENCLERFSIVAANLMHAEIMRLASCLTGVLHAGGRLILSGLLHSQLPPVVQALEGLGLRHCRTMLQAEWGCLIFSSGDR